MRPLGVTINDLDVPLPAEHRRTVNGKRVKSPEADVFTFGDGLIARTDT